MAKIQIKSETRKDLSFFPSSFEDYIPKGDKVRMLDSIVRSMDRSRLLRLQPHPAPQCPGRCRSLCLDSKRAAINNSLYLADKV